MNRPGRLILFWFLILLGSVQLWISLAGQAVFTSLPGEVSRWVFISDPSILVKRAEQHLFTGEIAPAHGLLTSALWNDPFYVPAWIKMAELYDNTGQRDRAVYIARYIHAFSAESALWQWDKALLDYQLDLKDFLAQDLTFIISENPSKRRKALDLAIRIWPDPDQLIDNIGRDALPILFKYCIGKGMLDNAIALWPVVADSNMLKDRDRLRFIDRLWTRDHVRMAAAVWKKYFDSRHLLHNGNFSKPLLNAGFGWRMCKKGRLKGLSWERIKKDGRYCIHFAFLGSHNLNMYHFHQIVPVRSGGRYMLTGTWRSKNVTTDQKPFVEIVGARCRMKPVSSGMISGNQEWGSFKVIFSVPDQCQLVNIRLRRKESLQIDNLIDGDMWLTGMKLKEMSQAVSERVQ